MVVIFSCHLPPRWLWSTWSTDTDVPPFLASSGNPVVPSVLGLFHLCCHLLPCSFILTRTPQLPSAVFLSLQSCRYSTFPTENVTTHCTTWRPRPYRSPPLSPQPFLLSGSSWWHWEICKAAAFQASDGKQSSGPPYCRVSEASRGQSLPAASYLGFRGGHRPLLRNPLKQLHCFLSLSLCVSVCFLTPF